MPVVERTGSLAAGLAPGRWPTGAPGDLGRRPSLCPLVAGFVKSMLLRLRAQLRGERSPSMRGTLGEPQRPKISPKARTRTLVALHSVLEKSQVCLHPLPGEGWGCARVSSEAGEGDMPRTWQEARMGDLGVVCALQGRGHCHCVTLRLPVGIYCPLWSA